MSRTKTIKEVEVKFSPAFDKAINGVKVIKKAAKPATKKPKAKAKAKTVKPVRTRAKSKYPRGYKVAIVDRQLTIDGEAGTYTLHELSGPKMDKTRYFIDEASVLKYISKNELGNAAEVALSGKGFQHIKGVVSAHKDLMDAALLPELETELPEKCDKTSIEDVDA
jgi:hypothetical protein